MKQLLSSYTFDSVAKTVTLNGVNVPLSQVLLIAGKGKILFSLADGVGAAGYTQGYNSVITLQSVFDLVSLDPLTIYYDDGIETVNPSTGIQGDDFNIRSFGASSTASTIATEDENRTSFIVDIPVTTGVTKVFQGSATTSAIVGSAIGATHKFSEGSVLSPAIRCSSANASSYAILIQTRKTDGIISDPRVYPNLRLWLDSADNSTLFDAVTGGNNVTDGNLVARWEDKSGNNNHAFQSTSTLRPSFYQKSSGSKTTGVYLNSADYMQFTTGALPAAYPQNKFTIFAVVNTGNGLGGSYSAISTNTCIVSKASPSSSNAGQWQIDMATADSSTQGGGFPTFKKYNASNSLKNYFGYGISASEMGHYTSTQSNVDISACLQFDGSNVNIIKGWDKANIYENNINASYSPNGDYLGFSLGQTIFRGYIKEILIYDSILTSTQIASIQRYITSKWGYTISTNGLKSIPNYIVEQ